MAKFATAFRIISQNQHFIIVIHYWHTENLSIGDWKVLVLTVMFQSS